MRLPADTCTTFLDHDLDEPPGLRRDLSAQACVIAHAWADRLESADPAGSQVGLAVKALTGQ
jgi:hypothetical protein